MARLFAALLSFLPLGLRGGIWRQLAESTFSGKNPASQNRLLAKVRLSEEMDQ
jgi:hypothetical protein